MAGEAPDDDHAREALDGGVESEADERGGQASPAFDASKRFCMA